MNNNFTNVSFIKLFSLQDFSFLDFPPTAPTTDSHCSRNEK